MRSNTIYFIMTSFMLILVIIPHSQTNNSISSERTMFPLTEEKFSDAETQYPIHYLIITPTNLIESLEPLARWKRAMGIPTEIISIDNITTTYAGEDLPEKIKTCLRTYYQDQHLTYVLLAGDHDTVPTRYCRIYDEYSSDGDYIGSDYYYGDLSGDWNSDGDLYWGERSHDSFDYEAEVYVGRLPVSSVTEMRTLVNNIIIYEREPVLGDWMHRAMYAGAFANFAEDYNDDSVEDWPEFDANRFNNFLKQQTLPSNWTSIVLGETTGIKPTDYPYDLSLSENNVKNTINTGNAIGMLSAHGSVQSISRLTFEADYDGDGLFDYTANPWSGGGTAVDKKGWRDFVDINSGLNPQDKLGMYWISACSAGTFDRSYDCLAEYFIKNTAIGCIASHSVSWYEDGWTERSHGGWYNEGMAFRFFEQLFTNASFQPGVALGLARADYRQDRIDSGVSALEPVWEDKSTRQFNLLGDPSVRIWNEIPTYLNINLTSTTAVVYNVTGDPISNVTLTLTNDQGLLWKNTTDQAGTVILPYNVSELEQYGCNLTAYKSGFLSSQIQLGDPQPITTSTTSSSHSSSTSSSFITETDPSTSAVPSSTSGSSTMQSNDSDPQSTSSTDLKTTNNPRESFSFLGIPTISSMLICTVLIKRRKRK